MTITLNRDALDRAEKLIAAGDVVRDERDDGSEHAPDADAENRMIERDGWDAYAAFPFGDFRKIHRCAVISLESRAAQYDHDEIARAAKRLLEKIDAD